MSVQSTAGQGSTFHAYLPSSPCEGRAELTLDVARETTRGQGQHVLYIDDDEVMAVMVHGLLLRLGYRATCILDAREAVATVARNPMDVDVVVTDFNMPNCSGLDVARALAGIRPSLPVAISSGFVSDELRASAARLGVIAVMQKEHTLEELGAVVQAALNTTAR